MDVLLLGDGGPLHAGDVASVLVLRDGMPMPGLVVELRHRANASHTSTGVWL